MLSVIPEGTKMQVGELTTSWSKPMHVDVINGFMKVVNRPSAPLTQSEVASINGFV